jgi:hypothetical protein
VAQLCGVRLFGSSSSVDGVQKEVLHQRRHFVEVGFEQPVPATEQV